MGHCVIECANIGLLLLGLLLVRWDYLSFTIINKGTDNGLIILSVQYKVIAETHKELKEYVTEILWTFRLKFVVGNFIQKKTHYL